MLLSSFPPIGRVRLFEDLMRIRFSPFLHQGQSIASAGITSAVEPRLRELKVFSKLMTRNSNALLVLLEDVSKARELSNLLDFILQASVWQQ
ncbi:hypothetical protein CEXT_678151 [Caerostris extrusa]|uniref:Uncharacterized protein n=1 Tax=Caerostris extrusa TaxID=172846 RepID=A0AAV4XYE1_CAEEX|nr:hypothetical protein CEXT_678151 [Caerostris extrusa]